MSYFDVTKVNTLKGHRDCVYALEVHKEHNLIFSAGGDGMVVMWDLSQENIGKLLAKVPASIYSIRYLSDLNRILIGQNFDGLHVIDLKDNNEVYNVQLTKSYIFDIQLNSDFIVVAEGQGKVIVLDRKTYKVLHEWDETDKSARSVSIQNNYVAVGYSDNFIRIFDLKSGSKTNEWEAHTNSVFKVLFGPDGKLISASRDANLKFWDLNGTLDESIIAHMFAINDVAFQSGEKYFATCSMDKSVKVWDYNERKLLKVIDKSRHAGHGTSVNKLLWIDYNNYIVSCSDDQTISVWDIKRSSE